MSVRFVRDDDDAVVVVKPVHFAQYCVECLLSLVVTAAAGRLAACGGCRPRNLVDEEDRARCRALFEELADGITRQTLDKIEPGVRKNGTLASPATARASRVFQFRRTSMRIP